jgi:hypothetical protein
VETTTTLTTTLDITGALAPSVDMTTTITATETVTP